tara:strand:+ start:6368 stop:6829 length:462 start_codon:yes stop_codon:yes gene_type:complete
MTKRQIILDAFAEIGLASYAFDLSPDQMQAALGQLDRMVSTWSTNGLKLGYFPAVDDLDEETGTPAASTDALVLNLAVRLAPSFGKTPSPDTKKAARGALRSLYNLSAAPLPMQVDTHLVPAGQGNRVWGDDPVYLADSEPYTAPDVTEIPQG